jgi:hypothetical protein
MVHTEWSLNPNIARQIFRVFGTPMIELFATKFNHKLAWYVSPIPDENAAWVDALSRPWCGLTAYAFPPAPVLPLVLKKIHQDSCIVILIAPCWPKRSWFANLLQLLVNRPLCIPPVKNLLSQGHVAHPRPELFNLHAWMLSNNRELREDFLSRQPPTRVGALETPPSQYTTADGRSSVIGVLSDRLILSEPLRLN